MIFIAISRELAPAALFPIAVSSAVAAALAFTDYTVLESTM